MLVDGFRFVNGGGRERRSGVDRPQLHPRMRDRAVEVLQDGASAIYGSDAIAGVVNIITKRQQMGFDASAQLSATRATASRQNYQLSWGNGGDGPLQIVVGGDYIKQNGMFRRRSGDFRFFRRLMPQLCCADGGCSGYLPKWPLYRLGFSTSAMNV